MGNMYSSRILQKGKITDLSKGFSLEGKVFSLYVKPKVATMDPNLVINCKLICDKEFGEFPVPLNDWTPGAIVRIASSAINLESYDVYYGAGEN